MNKLNIGSNHCENIRCTYCDADFEEDCDIDLNQKGYWCESCDAYNYFNSSVDLRKYTLVLEDKSANNDVMIKNITLKKRLSPLRYPGGKSKIAHFILNQTNLENTNTFVGAYAGGASVELALLQAGIIKNLILNDFDFGIYSIFVMIKERPSELIHKVKSACLSHEDFFLARDVIKSNYEGIDLPAAAWSALIGNRLSFSGIYKANPLGGIKGSTEQLLSRWNPEDLCKRINTIHAMSANITVLNDDALSVIEEYYWKNRTTIFIDPPYYKQGESLYRHYYNKNDHIELSSLLESLYTGFPGADLIVTYDNEPFIKNLYQFPNTLKINRSFSTSMVRG